MSDYESEGHRFESCWACQKTACSIERAVFLFFLPHLPRPSGRGSVCQKTYITKRVVRPTPINPQKAATCAWLFALLKGGAPRWSGGRTAILSLVRCPDGHTFFAFLRTTGPARERSMGAAARRQRGSAVWERRHSASPLQKLEKVA